MITVRLRGDTLTVSGHAGYAPPGQDIVCAAASTVVVLCEHTLSAFGCDWRERETAGAVHITAAGPQAALILRTAADTLRQLAARYPRHVQVA